MAWYLSETFADVTDVATFEEKKRTVSMVIRRMIKHDKSIVAVKSAVKGSKRVDDLLLRRAPPP